MAVTVTRKGDYVTIDHEDYPLNEVTVHVAELPQLLADLSQIDLDVTRERKAAASMAQHTQYLGLDDDRPTPKLDALMAMPDPFEDTP